MASRDNHLLKSYIQSRESLNICVIMTNNCFVLEFKDDLYPPLKTDISRPEIQVQMNDRAEARRQGLALGNYRTQLLLQALQRNIGTITVAKCGQWFRFMQTYLPRCINTPFALHLRKINIHLCPNLFHYGHYTLINTNITFICA